MSRETSLTRRRFLAAMAASLAAGLTVPLAIPLRARAEDGAGPEPLLRKIPSTGEALPAIGMGTWITFNVGRNAEQLARRLEILREFFGRGGTVVDSSPMYGTAEQVMGDCLQKFSDPPPLFSATKVWTRRDGPEQMAESRELWGVKKFDLMQIHNLLNWQQHLKTLRADKEAGRVRYIGITTSHGRRHDDVERIMRTEPIDFVQFTYNIVDRDAENRLLPLATDKGIAVIANRPFQQKALFDRFAHNPLPSWAGDIGCANWAEFFLKFIVSHPAVTCAIPATSQLDHMRENMGALYGPMPDTATRERMRRYVESL